ncbi:MAG: hypothetical protein ACK5KR_08135 [Breznakia sp.]
MNEKTRAKRYEDLRKSVEKDANDTTTHQRILRDLNDISTSKKQKAYTPSHQKSIGDTQLQNKLHNDNTDEFKNEYLDNFIQEVKEYNMQNGIRENDDTKLDILQQLSTKQRMKRAEYMEQMDDDNKAVVSNDDIEDSIFSLGEKIDSSIHCEPEELAEKKAETMLSSLAQETSPKENKTSSTQDIARQVQDLLKDADHSNDVAMNLFEDEKQEKFVEENTAYMQDEQNHTEMQGINHDEKSPNYASREDLIEQTHQLKVQLDEYEEELTSLSTGIDKNNRLLNVIIFVLLVVLVGVIAVVLYWLISGGIV